MAMTKMAKDDYIAQSFGEISQTAQNGTYGLVVGGIYQSSPVTIASGEFSPINTDASGNLMVNVAAGETINIGTMSVGTIDMIKAGTISAGTINSGTINAGTINAGTIGTVAAVGIIHNAGTIQAGTIGTVAAIGIIHNAGTIQAGTISAATVNAGTINSGTINAGTINSGTINAGTINAGTMTIAGYSYYHHVGTAGSVSGTVKSGAGVLRAIIYGIHTTDGTYAFYDSVGTSGTVIGISKNITNPAIYDAAFTNGLTVVSGSVCDLTIVYR